MSKFLARTSNGMLPANRQSVLRSRQTICLCRTSWIVGLFSSKLISVELHDYLIIRYFFENTFVEPKFIKQCNIKKLIVINKISLLITYVYINYCIQKSCNFCWTGFSIFFTYNIAIFLFIHLLSKNILRLLTFLKISSLTILHNYKSIEIFLYRNVTKLYLYWTSHYLIICLAFFLLEYIEWICWIFARQFGKTLIVYN